MIDARVEITKIRWPLCFNTIIQFLYAPNQAIRGSSLKHIMTVVIP